MVTGASFTWTACRSPIQGQSRANPELPDPHLFRLFRSRLNPELGKPSRRQTSDHAEHDRPGLGNPLRTEPSDSVVVPATGESGCPLGPRHPSAWSMHGSVPETFRRRSGDPPAVPESFRNCSEAQCPCPSGRGQRPGHTEASRGAYAAVTGRSLLSRFGPGSLHRGSTSGSKTPSAESRVGSPVQVRSGLVVDSRAAWLI